MFTVSAPVPAQPVSLRSEASRFVAATHGLNHITLWGRSFSRETYAKTCANLAMSEQGKRARRSR
jgi:hypothetical protein